ncbi:DUF6438 domain-containing protein [Epilithonimonas ginsengisoli]|uniref:DUF6438 domain-containing protein n=1 Tax=Epilithonimonas ginsengisoli TaxID=1245592 RepID=A0ABU4JGJ7_9FLAO|nr:MULTISPECIES: DUF6438 domain-containing protein [Chryseobacterium group]MBV6880097.1 hypothetical protein [Epilithonimonas sp. FP105]MDW8548747.1 DUF6438 domain-containing protein [Epilithonimonas ginsengisoli]
MKYLFSLVVFLGLMSCKTSQNSQTSQYSAIEYQVGPCFGFCPTYKITIDADRNAILEAEHFNFSKGGSKDDMSKPREGTFKASLSTEDYKRLVDATDAANIKTLNDSYIDKRIMDASKINLRVTFADGTKRDIAMSAGEKPKKLTDLTTLITEIKENQKWEKVN